MYAFILPRPINYILSSSHVSFNPVGGSIDSDCAFEGDYAVPPLSMAEGLQHIRIMEGVSRSLPSSPLLTHQTSSSRLPSVRKVFGMATGTKLSHSHDTTIPNASIEAYLGDTITYLKCSGTF